LHEILEGLNYARGPLALAMKFLQMGFEKRQRDATPREEQCEHRSAWAAHDAA
jgi:hypothetical protein